MPTKTEILDLHARCNNKPFWETVKPLFSENVATTQDITLIERNAIIDDDKLISQMILSAMKSQA